MNNVLEYLDNIVKKNPEKIGFQDEKSSISFKEFNDISDNIASFFINNNIYNKPILIFIKRSIDVIVSQISVIKSGNFYVGLSSDMSMERINNIVDKIGETSIICDENSLELVQKIDKSLNIIMFNEVKDYNKDSKKLLDIRKKSLDVDPIYIVFTSGSTGKPKGVIANHRNLIDYVEQLSSALGFDENTIFGNQAPLYLDACFKDLYPTLKFGAKMIIIPKKLFMLPVKLIEFINEYKINTLCWVVSALSIISKLNAFEFVTPKYLKLIAFGGERFNIKDFNIWKTNIGDARFFNLYGPTEATGMTCYHELTTTLDKDDIMPVGRPFNNSEVILINEEGKKCDINEKGEIHIKGSSITFGYYNDKEKSDAVFIQNPLNDYYRDIVYKTGDIGYFDENNNLIFVGRSDNQIKHMGYRIELDEIELKALECKDVAMVKCIYKEETKNIILIYEGDIDKSTLKKHLKDKLNFYMIPSKIIKLDNMPLTSNGKIDKQRLVREIEKC